MCVLNAVRHSTPLQDPFRPATPVGAAPHHSCHVPTIQRSKQACSGPRLQAPPGTIGGCTALPRVLHQIGTVPCGPCPAAGAARHHRRLHRPSPPGPQEQPAGGAARVHRPPARPGGAVPHWWVCSAVVVLQWLCSCNACSGSGTGGFAVLCFCSLFCLPEAFRCVFTNQSAISSTCDPCRRQPAGGAPCRDGPAEVAGEAAGKRPPWVVPQRSAGHCVALLGGWLPMRRCACAGVGQPAALVRLQVGVPWGSRQQSLCCLQWGSGTAEK